ncbi:MYPU_1760 family metalloprotease [Mycoplasma procyoni]|uniref:MYPU_1760 family metalloprotease n=1 Tax=Mycoplasma procyoni TaxID=568784 RepID=UPI00197BC225|nr:hypothetical protein [Mycoplasma procyoni]MBN3534840.1 hypothetical protein [Mycoplasma procyoni]
MNKRKFVKFGFVAIPLLSSFSMLSCQKTEQTQQETKSFVNIYSYSKNGKHFLNPQQLEDFQKQIKTRLFYGPEIKFLKGIYIDKDLALFKNNDSLEAFFSANSQEIYLNTSKFQNIKEEDKVELLLQIFYHEYIHFLDSVYLSNKKYIIEPQNYFIPFQNIKKIYDKRFVTKFLDDLNATDKNFDNFRPSLENANKNYLFSQYTYKDIINNFTLAEYKENSKQDFPKIQENTVFSIKNPFDSQLKKVYSDPEYNYSLEELLARESFKHFYLESKNSLPNWDNNVLKEWIKTASVQKEKNGVSHSLKPIVNGGAFGNFELKDKDQKSFVLKNKIQNLFNDFLSEIGAFSPISAIMYNDSLSYQNGILENSRNYDQIKILGNLENKITGIIFSTKDQKEQISYVDFVENNYKAKKTFESKTFDLLPKTPVYSYVSRDWIDAQNIDFSVKPKFWSDLNKNNEVEQNEINLNNIDQKEYYATSFRSYLDSYLSKDSNKLYNLISPIKKEENESDK